MSKSDSNKNFEQFLIDKIKNKNTSMNLANRDYVRSGKVADRLTAVRYQSAYNTLCEVLEDYNKIHALHLKKYIEEAKAELEKPKQ